ncbi:hypothetical protein M9Y10_032995 [Tritrichomonas musculus]|uniref:Protein kinase domain-containing protein n=1 Tax=Tritrichomonas musculus TaxID=1915356 RepID=A0ABR2GYQ3_9EUKA
MSTNSNLHFPRLTKVQFQSTASQRLLCPTSPSYEDFPDKSRSGINRPTVVIPKKIFDYSLKEEIGYGAFSTVVLAINTQTNLHYACKVIPKTMIIKARMEQRFESEVRILQQFVHPGIVRLYNLLQDSLNYYLICELCPEGTLYDYQMSRGKITGYPVKFIFRQLATTLLYIHKQGIVHRDIKPENILINPQTLNIKFIDFGLSAHFEDGLLLDTNCGSPNYTSPECASGRPYNGFKSDVWSLGVVLYSLVCGMLPWTKKVLPQLLKEIQECNFFIPSNVEPECKDLIQLLMNPNPETRITLEEVLNHPWIADIPDTPLRSLEDSQQCEIDIDKVNQFFKGDLSSPSSKSEKLNQEARRLLLKARRKSISSPKLKKISNVIARPNIITKKSFDTIQDFFS